MLVTCEQMSQAERRLFSSGVSPEPYMNEAGRLCALAILDFLPRPSRAFIFCGKGNNGGDALVVARWLKHFGWQVEIFLCEDESRLSPLARKKYNEFLSEP